MKKYKENIQNFKKYKPLIYELVVRDLKVKYRRSVLGYLWSLLNPLLMMIVMTVVFSTLFKSDIDNFALYLICGQTLWNFFNESTTMAMTSVINNSSLIKKVYIPKYIFPISRVFSSFVNMLFSFGAIIIVMIATRAQFTWTCLLFPIPIIFLFIFCCGVSLIISALCVYFRDVQHLYSVLMLAWTYLTPIFYPLSALPEYVQRIIKLNPMYHYINFFRNLVLFNNIPGPNTWFACIASSAVVLIIGLLVFKKLQRNFILYL